MKRHAIIPIFIPHNGCPHDCVFCNQRRITARQETPTASEIEGVIERNLSTIEAQGINDIEIAYYGGSFTGIPIQEQNRLLAPAMKYKEAGRILRIRLSTRPDYISDSIIDNLRAHSVDAVELGAQSFDDEVLSLCARGHTSQQTKDAFSALKAAGFETGLQLMSGLPGSTPAKDIASATTVAALNPTTSRIYPTVILKDTALYDMYVSGKYIPPTNDEMVETVKQMYLIIKNAGITILRVGLKSTDLITSESDSVVGSYHPAFRQLVEGSIAKDIIEEKLLQELSSKGLTQSSAPHDNSQEIPFESLPYCSSMSVRAFKYNKRNDSQDTKISPFGDTKLTAYIHANPESISDAAGHNGKNRKYFAEKFPNISLKYIKDTNIKTGDYIVELK